MNMSYKGVANLIFLLALFPYISPFNTPFDTQPWALLAALIFTILLLLKRRFFFPRPLIVLLFTTIYAGVIYLIYLSAEEADPLEGLRSLAGYSSLFLLSFASYKTFKYVKIEVFIFAVVVWLLGATFQFLYGPEIVERFVPRIGVLGSWGYRGATSLAPEPAFYATMCAVFLILNEIFYKEKRYRFGSYLAILFISLFQILISYSGVGLLTLLLFLLSKLINVFVVGRSISERAKHFFLALILTIFIIIVIPGLPAHSVRLGYIFTNLLNDPIHLWQDRSVSTRIGNIMRGFYGGLIASHGLGFGLGRLEKGRVPEWLLSLIGVEFSWGGRIMGGFVSAVYELGIAGVILLGAVLRILLNSIKRNERMRGALLTSAIVFFGPRLSFDPLAFPFVGYLLGIHLLYSSEDYYVIRPTS